MSSHSFVHTVSLFSRYPHFSHSAFSRHNKIWFFLFIFTALLSLSLYKYNIIKHINQAFTLKSFNVSTQYSFNHPKYWPIFFCCIIAIVHNKVVQIISDCNVIKKLFNNDMCAYMYREDNKLLSIKIDRNMGRRFL